MATTNLNIRTEKAIKDQAEEIFNYGLWEDSRGMTFLNPEGSDPYIITQPEHLRNEILRGKCIHN